MDTRQVNEWITNEYFFSESNCEYALFVLKPTYYHPYTLSSGPDDLIMINPKDPIKILPNITNPI